MIRTEKGRSGSYMDPSKHFWADRAARNDWPPARHSAADSVRSREMPKRTNDFQSLIATIYDQVTAENGTVSESAMVFDRDANILREVDVLVEYRYAHHNFKLVIECRDRARKDTVEWIDALIGKLSSLAVDKIVAVSKEGFTEAAKTKATMHGIEVLTVEEAVEQDWERFSIKPGVSILSDENYRLHDVQFREGETYRSLKELGLCSPVLKEEEEVGSIKEVFEYFFLEFLLPRIQKKVKAERLDIFKTLADLSKLLHVESDHKLPGFSVRLADGEEIDVSDVKFIVHGTRHLSNIKQKHMKFNDMMVSTSQYLDADGSLLKLSIVQDPETEQIHGRWRRTES